MTSMFQVAIKTYQRAASFQDKTLALLRRHGIDDDRVTLFVVDQAEEDSYRKEIPDFGGNLVQCGFGVRQAVTTYRKHYEPGTHVLHMDDDIINIVRKRDTKLVPVGDLAAYIEEMFHITKTNGCRLWGIYSAANAYFMKDRVVHGLKFCPGVMHGFVSDAGQDEDLLPRVQYKDDYNASLAYFCKDGGVIRDDGVTAHTAYFRADGGGTAGEGHTDRLDGHIEDATWLVQAYPGLCRLVRKKNFGGLDVRLVTLPCTSLGPSPSEVEKMLYD